MAWPSSTSDREACYTNEAIEALTSTSYMFHCFIILLSTFTNCLSTFYQLLSTFYQLLSTFYQLLSTFYQLFIN